MQHPDLAPYIDHTLLKPETTSADIGKICEEARRFSFKAVCVNPAFVAEAEKNLRGSGVLVAAVIGFPLGASLTTTKAFEADLALRDGASELDMVMRIDLAKQGRWQELELDVAAVVRVATGKTVKVILETGLLTRDEVAKACAASERAGAAFVKTATGFLGRGATVEDIQLMRSSCSTKVAIKASGGVKNADQAWALIRAGAARIGTSSGVQLVLGDKIESVY